MYVYMYSGLVRATIVFFFVFYFLFVLLLCMHVATLLLTLRVTICIRNARVCMCMYVFCFFFLLHVTHNKRTNDSSSVYGICISYIHTCIHKRALRFFVSLLYMGGVSFFFFLRKV